MFNDYPPGHIFVPVSQLARRHGVLTSALLAELKKARVSTIVVANQHQVLEHEFRDWVLRKLAQAKAEESAQQEVAE